MGFEKDARSYPRNGKNYVSVTTVLGCLDKPALIPWAVNSFEKKALEGFLGAKKRGENLILSPSDITDILAAAKKSYRQQSGTATSIGTQVHNAISVYFKDGTEPSFEDDRALAAFLAFLDFLKKNEIVPIASEQVVYDDDHEYAGTMDLAAFVNGVPMAVDFKCSSGIYKENRLQVAAYMHAWNLEGKDPLLHTGAVLRLDKVTAEPEFKVYEPADMAGAVESFLHLTAFWYREEKPKRW